MFHLIASLFLAAAQPSTPPLHPAWLNQYDKDVCSERSPEVNRRRCLREAVRNRQQERAEPGRRIHWITLDDICPSADAEPGETVLITDEINEPLECPDEPR